MQQAAAAEQHRQCVHGVYIVFLSRHAYDESLSVDDLGDKPVQFSSVQHVVHLHHPSGG
jgi:hypothetical protein